MLARKEEILSHGRDSTQGSRAEGSPPVIVGYRCAYIRSAMDLVLRRCLTIGCDLRRQHRLHHGRRCSYASSARELSRSRRAIELSACISEIGSAFRPGTCSCASQEPSVLTSPGWSSFFIPSHLPLFHAWCVNTHQVTARSQDPSRCEKRDCCSGPADVRCVGRSSTWATVGFGIPEESTISISIRAWRWKCIL